MIFLADHWAPSTSRPPKCLSFRRSWQVELPPPGPEGLALDHSARSGEGAGVGLPPMNGHAEDPQLDPMLDHCPLINSQLGPDLLSPR